MSSPFLLLLLLPLSIYPCDGRHLGAPFKDSSRFSQRSGKEVAKAMADQMSVPVKLTQPSEERSGATNERLKCLGVSSRNGEGKSGSASGSDVLMSSPSDAGWPKKAQLKVRSRERVRSLLGQGAGEETIDPNESGVVEDLVTMDYSKPQRGPSIHN